MSEQRCRQRDEFSASLRADGDALCDIMIMASADRIDADQIFTASSDAIAQHGLAGIAEYLTCKTMRILAAVSRKRRGTPPALILDEYFARLFARQSAELRDLVRSQMIDGRHPPIEDRKLQLEFIWSLLVLHTGAAIELAGNTPHDAVIVADDSVDPIRRAAPELEYRPRSGGEGPGAAA